MNVVLACMLLCACAAVALPSHQLELRSASSEKHSSEERDDGGWRVKTDQNRGGGSVVRTEVNKKWDVTKDGKVQAEVRGHWERTYGGPDHGRRDHGYGASIGGSWGK